MKTELRPFKSNNDIAYTAEVLKQGGLVVFPTETVYGLGVMMDKEEALQKVYEIKGRDTSKPLSILAADVSQVYEAAEIIEKEPVERIAAAFWPGPLTMVFPKDPQVPDAVTAGKDTIGIRIPDHPFAKALVELVGAPLATTSANLSGMPAAVSAEEAFQALNGKVDLIIDGGTSTVKVASTVAAIEGKEITVYREGVISKEALLQAISGTDE